MKTGNGKKFCNKRSGLLLETFQRESFGLSPTGERDGQGERLKLLVTPRETFAQNFGPVNRRLA